MVSQSCCYPNMSNFTSWTSRASIKRNVDNCQLPQYFSPSESFKMAPEPDGKK